MTDEVYDLIGKWVKQYCAGYWYVLDVKPKIADEDHQGDNTSWKKGDSIGWWVLMKKAFTDKMRFRLDSDYCDSSWCKPVSAEENKAIIGFFEEHAEQKKKFDSYEFSPRPTITNVWLKLTGDLDSQLERSLSGFSRSFTADDIGNCFARYGIETTDPASASHLLNLFSLPWELTEDNNALFNGFELLPLNQKVDNAVKPDKI